MQKLKENSRVPAMPATHVIRDETQVRALAGPLQHQIVAVLEREGPSSARELAIHVGKGAEILYYHLRKLEAVGVIRTVDQRPTTRRPERVFMLAARELVLDPDSRRPAFLTALASLQRSLLAMATRLYARAISDPVSVRKGARRNLCVIQQYGRLRPRDLAELNRRLEAIAEFVAERDDQSVRNFVSLTISMSPVTRD